MQERTLGPDPKVSALGFGAMGMSQSYGPGRGCTAPATPSSWNA